MDNNLIQKASKISNWQKPGGTLGMIVTGLGIGGGLILLSKLLPFLLTITWGLLELSILGIVLFLFFYTITNKQFQQIFSTCFFILMRSITGLVIELDPIAILEKKVVEMDEQLDKMRESLGKLTGNNVDLQRKIKVQENELREALTHYEAALSTKDSSASMYAEQVDDIKSYIQRLVEAKNQSDVWLAFLQDLAKATSTRVVITKKDIKRKKEEYLMVKEQYKAFSSMMSILNDKSDGVNMFNKAMETIEADITNRLGAMTYYMNTTNNALEELAVRHTVTSKNAQNILAQYKAGGIDSLFSDKKELVKLEFNQGK